MLAMLIQLLIICLVLGVIYWITTLIPLPPIGRTIVQVVFVVIILILAIDILLGLAGPGRILWR